MHDEIQKLVRANNLFNDSWNIISNQNLAAKKPCKKNQKLP